MMPNTGADNFHNEWQSSLMKINISHLFVLKRNVCTNRMIREAIRKKLATKM